MYPLEDLYMPRVHVTLVENHCKCSNSSMRISGIIHVDLEISVLRLKLPQQSSSRSEMGMPISSGAEGHVGFGVDTSVKWLPEGGQGTHSPLPCKVNSYLQRYLYWHPEATQRKAGGQSQGAASVARAPQPAQCKLDPTKEKHATEGETTQKHQQEHAAPESGVGSTAPACNANSNTSASARNATAASKDSGSKISAPRSSICTLL
ncbi:uncharacterized protein LOC120406456 [Mauremys reevesii]|uniref:uncharacterized protein LOC120406456 n=1 Tax=Mauremys reevesii TaxID=260615 RepID=UPI00193F7297|nr:uncharacterized protein LOC120406456 [Mauremys reevesii]XP_039397285.1 uncharacterized protein LOC120406456 [Mauremys reevesii]XP_039397287.1 uncharacterized protein LOC120406456 [Mauremys reevesii]